MKETDDLRSEGEAYVSPSRRSSTGTDGPLRQGPTSGGSFVEQDGRVAVAQVATLDLGGQLEVLDEFRAIAEVLVRTPRRLVSLIAVHHRSPRFSRAR